MIVLENNHVNEAIRIMKQYSDIVKNLTMYENYISDLKKSIIELKDNIDMLSKKDTTELKKQADLYQLIRDHEIYINNTQEKISSYLEMINDLKKSSNVLYSILKEKNPGATDEQIRTELLSKIDKQKINI